MMKPLSFKMTSEHLLCCLVLSLVVGATYSNTTSTPETETLSTTPMTTVLVTNSPPENVNSVTVVTQDESSITLRWDKVNNISTYVLQYNDSGSAMEENITASLEEAPVTNQVSSLTAGTKYNFILFTVLDGIRSTGYTFEAVTAPENVNSVTVVTQNESSITLRWDKVNNISTYVLQYNDSGSAMEENITTSLEEAPVTHQVSSLTAGTKYNFILFTVLEGIRSSGHTFEAVTVPENVNSVTVVTQNEGSITLRWDKVNNISTYVLQYNDSGSAMEENITASLEEASVTHQVSLLTAGTKYNFILYTVLDGIRSSGHTFEAVTAPENVNSVTVVTQNEGSITLRWDKVNNISTYVLQYNDSGSAMEENITTSLEEAPVTHQVSSLTAGTKYNFILYTVLDGIRSSGHTFEAVTVPENVNSVDVVTQNEGSITLRWDKVNNISTYVLQYNDSGSAMEENITASLEEASVTHQVSSLTVGTKYNFILYTVLEGIRSSGHTFEAVTAPENVNSVTVVTQNESSITLRWDKVNNISTYVLQYNDSGSAMEENITTSLEEAPVTHQVSSLTAGTKYNFILYTVLDGIRSTGHTFEAVTAPENVNSVNVVTQSEGSITLRWDKVNNISTYVLQYNDSGSAMEENITASLEEASVTHQVSSLTVGTKYNFILFTVFEKVRSTGHTFEAVTAPGKVNSVKVVTQDESSITLRWDKVNNISTYVLQYDSGSAMEENITASLEEASVTYQVSSLTSGTKYNFILYTVFEKVKSTGYPFEAVTAPENVKDVKVMTQTETNITLQWIKVDNILKYTLLFNGGEINVTVTGQAQAEYTILGLSSGTKYDCSLFALFENVRSSGVDCTASTVPSMVASVSVTERSVTTIKLEWNVAMDKNWSYFLHFNGENLQFHPNQSMKVVSYFQSLQPGTEYPFSVITSFSGLNSTVYTDFTVTAINCTSVTWRVTNKTIQGMIDGLVSNATATYESQKHFSYGGSNVIFTDLYPGATYNVNLEYEKNSKIFPQCSHQLTILPPDLIAHCKYWAAGYSIYIVWNKAEGVWTAVEVNVTGKSSTVHEVKDQGVEISGFSPAKTYEVSFGSLSGTLRNSEPFVFSCSTDPRGVIAGAVVAVLLIAVLACLAVFIFLKRPDIISRKKSFIGGSKQQQPNKKCNAISVAKFPDHFCQLSADENRGFSEEYESLMAVGTEQTKREALLPDNKPKNRFNNVLPYDWCRVKLTTSNPNADSDYINASYMPGYNSNREYIATQGPLPSTVNDFWRMVWEQRVKGIVMVTNCTEGGRIKCERYWPAESKPCPYGELLVITKSEYEEPNWTLREFTVKHENTSEERTVKHFHFTAWPDHGVPQGTGVLIQFRELVRQHIQREGATSPTVVHCSAGVGRTGTIIALDVLLQQLEKERAVGIKEFVHKMRLNRPHMVQMESQYVFLHQCIWDCLQPNENTEDNIYENADLIYENATALKQLHRNT